MDKSKQQEIFSKAYKGLRDQGFMRSIGENIRNEELDSTYSGCAYRGSDGRKCAVGHLIDDQHYSSSIEGGGVTYARVSNALQESLGFGLTYDDEIFLLELQTAHDSGVEPDSMKANLARFARLWGMEIPE